MRKLILVSIMLMAFTLPAFSEETAAPAAPTAEVAKVVPTINVPAVVTPVPVSDTGSITAPSGEEMKAYFANLMNVKGAGTMALVIMIVQGLVFALRSSLGAYAGIWRFLAISGLTWVLGTLSFMYVNHVPFVEAFLNGANLMLAQLFVNQAWKQYTKMSDDKKKIANAK